jgi:starvation-inducible DNA-binding protein
MATSQAQAHLPSLGEHVRDEVGHLLQLTLGELLELSLVGKQLHWNIVGPGFRELHLHLDELVDEWRDASDEVAERASAIGVSPDGRSQTIAAQSDLDPVESGFVAVPEAVRQLVERLAAVDERIRDRVQRLDELDLTTQDLLIGVTETLEKQLWMLRSQL